MKVIMKSTPKRSAIFLDESTWYPLPLEPY
jgi:hypothetical protein